MGMGKCSLVQLEWMRKTWNKDEKQYEDYTIILLTKDLAHSFLPHRIFSLPFQGRQHKYFI